MKKIIAILLICSGVAFAADPNTLPLLQSTDITYLGYFSFSTAGGAFRYGGMGLATSADSQSMYVGGDLTAGRSVGKISIPDISGIATVQIEPTVISGSADPTNNNDISAALIYNSRLIVSKRVPYDGDGNADSSHQSCSTSIDSCTELQTFAGVPHPNFVSGYMGHIPTEWQSLLGGPAFAGNSLMSIASACSNGPSFYVFNPDDIDGSGTIPNYPLMNFPLTTRIMMDVNLDDGVSGNDWLSKADYWNGGMVFPSGTRSVLFISTHGYGPHTYKDAGDTCNPGGDGARPYRRQVTAFDASDLAAVKDGRKLPSAVNPYAYWTLPGPSDTCSRFTYGGVNYDDSTRRIYATLYYEDTQPVVHVWKVSGGTTTRRATGGGTIAGP